MGYVTFLLKQPSQARLGGIVDRIVGRFRSIGEADSVVVLWAVVLEDELTSMSQVP